jgi:hypothetical protein
MYREDDDVIEEIVQNAKKLAALSANVSNSAELDVAPATDTAAPGDSITVVGGTEAPSTVSPALSAAVESLSSGAADLNFDHLPQHSQFVTARRGGRHSRTLSSSSSGDEFYDAQERWA